MDAYKVVLTDGIYEISASDYGRAMAFKLYNQSDSAFDATGYTAYVKVYDDDGIEILTEISPSWTLQSAGTGTFALTSTNHLASAGRFNWEIQLEKAGEIRTFRGIRPIQVLPSPTGARLP